MTFKERLLAVYAGEQPDQVPFMLDLSHWFYHRHHLPWDLSRSYDKPERELIDYHREHGVGFYMPNLGSFFVVDHAEDVAATCTKGTRGGQPEIVWRLETPIGNIQRARVWEPTSYAWGISEWGIRCERDLRVFGHVMSRRTFRPLWERWQAWQEASGEDGVVYLPLGYSAMGYLLNYWMGVEQTMYATIDMPGVLEETVRLVNANLLELVDLLCESPAPIVIMGDNFSSDVQPPSFFERWSKPFYQEAINRLHAAGKYVAVHIDGKLAGALEMIAELGADCADAVTPQPLGDLTPAQCRTAAGDMILSGGVSPDLWAPTVPLTRFDAAAEAWLEQRHQSPRVIANAGDQVPPGAEESRITRLRDIVATDGRF